MNADIADTLAGYCKNPRKFAQLYPHIIFIIKSRYYHIFRIKNRSYLCRNGRILRLIANPVKYYYNNWIYTDYSCEDLITITYDNICIIYSFRSKYYWRFDRKIISFNYNTNGVFADLDNLVAYYTTIGL